MKTSKKVRPKHGYLKVPWLNSQRLKINQAKNKANWSCLFDQPVFKFIDFGTYLKMVNKIVIVGIYVIF